MANNEFFGNASSLYQTELPAESGAGLEPATNVVSKAFVFPCREKRWAARLAGCKTLVRRLQELNLLFQNVILPASARRGALRQLEVEKLLRALSSELLCHRWRQRRDSNPRPRASVSCNSSGICRCLKTILQ